MSGYEGECSEPTLTTQGAGLRPRVLAFALDTLLIAAYAIALAAVTFAASASPLRGTLAILLATPASRDAVAFVTIVLPVILYFALQEGSARQGTWGKRKLGLRVTALDGGQLPLGRALGRALGKFLPWQIAHTCLFHFPGWPLAPAAPPSWVIAGFGLVWLLVISYLALLGGVLGYAIFRATGWLGATTGVVVGALIGALLYRRAGKG